MRANGLPQPSPADMIKDSSLDTTWRKERLSLRRAANRGGFLQILLAKADQRTLTQKIGVTLTLFREFDNSLSDNFVDLVLSIEKSKRTASHLERHAHDSFGLAIESRTI
jgi:hypothetical protein